MKNKLLLSIILLILSALTLSACASKRLIPIPPSGNANMANPASVFCKDKGGREETRRVQMVVNMGYAFSRMVASAMNGLITAVSAALDRNPPPQCPPLLTRTPKIRRSRRLVFSYLRRPVWMPMRLRSYH